MKKTLRLLFFCLLASVSYSETLDQGTWMKKSFKIKGSWKIEKLADGTRELQLSEDFKTRKAPDLKLIFHPMDLKEVTSKNALEDAVVLSLLTSPNGKQSYSLPADLNLEKYQSLLIHCEEYSKLWGGTPLKL